MIFSIFFIMFSTASSSPTLNFVFLCFFLSFLFSRFCPFCPFSSFWNLFHSIYDKNVKKGHLLSLIICKLKWILNPLMNPMELAVVRIEWMGNICRNVANKQKEKKKHINWKVIPWILSLLLYGDVWWEKMNNKKHEKRKNERKKKYVSTISSLYCHRMIFEFQI